MNKPLPLSRKALQQTVFYTILFSLLAHGYRFLNMSFSGDAALIARLEECARRIMEYLGGAVDNIAELEARIPLSSPYGLTNVCRLVQNSKY